MRMQCKLNSEMKLILEWKSFRYQLNSPLFIDTVKFLILYFFKGPFWGAYFWRGLYSKGLIYGRKFAFQNRLGYPYSWKEICRFCFVLLCIWGQFSKNKPWGAYIWRGELTEGFLCYWFGGLIFGGVYTWRGLFSKFYSSRMKNVIETVSL